MLDVGDSGPALGQRLFRHQGRLVSLHLWLDFGRGGSRLHCVWAFFWVMGPQRVKALFPFSLTHLPHTAVLVLLLYMVSPHIQVALHRGA